MWACMAPLGGSTQELLVCMPRCPMCTYKGPIGCTACDQVSLSHLVVLAAHWVGRRPAMW